MAQQQFLVIKARNVATGQTVKNQNLDGSRYELRQRALAETAARDLADKMSQRTGENWIGFVEVFTPRT